VVVVVVVVASKMVRKGTVVGRLTQRDETRHYPPHVFTNSSADERTLLCHTTTNLNVTAK
jgi:hypothetical protein